MYAKEKIKQLIKKRKKITFDQLKVELKLSKHEKREFRKLINDMLNEDIIAIDSKGFIVMNDYESFNGVFEETKHDYGFVKTTDNIEYFIPAKYTKGAMSGDEVLITTLDRGPGRTVGKVVKILKRAKKYITVDLINKGKKIKVVPEKDFGYFLKLDFKGRKKIFKDGKYQVLLTSYDDKKKKFTGEIIKFIADKDDKYMDLLSLVAKNDLPTSFSYEVSIEAQQVAKEPIIVGNRVDYRNLYTVTIDGEDAKDFDDAISVVKVDGKYRLYVHIADVSHYVKENSFLDKEAFTREFSVYLPGLTIPMLPQILSNDVCSLNPNVDRYTLSVAMEFSENELPKLISIDKAIINSNHRLIYSDVNTLFKNRDFDSYDEDLKEQLFIAEEAYKILKSQSEGRGTIEFLSDEAKFILDEDNKIIAIEKRKQEAAEELIEEFMIATNRVIASKFQELEIPFLYRIHEKPTPEKLLAMKELLKPFGVSIADDPDSMDIQDIMVKLTEHPSFERINDIVLRSMMKAKYSDENLGHYALALRNYSHFTSPIRRYPDLIIHRIISDYLNGKLNEKKKRHYDRIVEEVGVKASETEKILVDLEREADSLKKAEYMSGKLNEIFVGKVSGITDFGIFVRLENTCEGLVGSSEFLKDYVFDRNSLTAITRHNNKKYEVGTKVKVRVVNVSISRMQIDFDIVERDDEDER